MHNLSRTGGKYMPIPIPTKFLLSLYMLFVFFIVIKKAETLCLSDFRLFLCRVEGRARTDDIQNHNLTL